jgi:predicted adenylyl cyclase CyaB
MHIEKEIKIPVDIDTVKRILDNKEFKIEKSSLQTTIRMDTQDLDLEKQDIFLRVREDTKEKVITLKRKVYEKDDKGEVCAREEYETEIGDIKVVEDILNILGFDKEWIMEKYRIEGKYKGLTMTFDEVPCGLYMEIEGEGNQIEDICRELELDFSKRIVDTYWDLWNEYREKNNVKEENMVFNAKVFQLEKLLNE